MSSVSRSPSPSRESNQAGGSSPSRQSNQAGGPSRGSLSGNGTTSILIAGHSHHAHGMEPAELEVRIDFCMTTITSTFHPEDGRPSYRLYPVIRPPSSSPSRSRSSSRSSSPSSSPSRSSSPRSRSPSPCDIHPERWNEERQRRPDRTPPERPEKRRRRE